MLFLDIGLDIWYYIGSLHECVGSMLVDGWSFGYISFLDKGSLMFIFNFGILWIYWILIAYGYNVMHGILS